jgi:hypothetical protein
LGWRPTADLGQRITRAVQWWLNRPIDRPLPVST